MKKIRQFLIPILMILISVGIIVAGIIYISNIRDTFWQQVVTDMEEITAQGAHSFDVYIDKDIRMLRSISLSLSQSSSDNTEFIEGRLDAFGTASIGRYSVVDIDRKLLYTDQREGIIALSDEEVDIYKTLSGNGVRKPYISIITGEKTLGYYECFEFSDGAHGIVQKEMPISVISDEFSISFYDDSGFSYIVSSDGDILIRSANKNINYTFLNVFDIIDLNGNSAKDINKIRTALKEGQSGVSLLKYKNEEYVYTYVPLTKTDGWHMISIIPNKVIARQTNKALKSSGVFAGMIIAIATIMMIFTLLARYNRKRLSEKDVEITYREQLFTMLANNTSDVFVMISADDTREVEYVSPNIERVLGISIETVKSNLAVLGQNIDGGNSKDYFEKLNNIPLNGSLSWESKRLNKLTGERCRFAETAYKITINNICKFVLALSDRTNEIKQRETLEHALKIADIANKSKSTFLSNMSHDIRTPINAIVGFCTLLQKDSDNPTRVRDYTRKITASSQHLLGLINDVLDMSKIESGKTTLNISEINLAEIIDDISTIIRSQTEAKRQDFEIVTSGIQTEHILGDKLRINQILINILSNAVKYTPMDGSIKMTIKQLPQRAKHYINLRFIVEDNGIGMSEEYLKTIFNPFTREINSTTNSVQGTGLGMPITKNLVELMGGTIKVESTKGVGSTFTVDLEFRTRDNGDDTEFLKGHNLSRALVVDDEVDICKGVADTLKDTGIESQYVTSGKDAVEKIKIAHTEDNDFDIVILDWQMPEMDGIETARQIRHIIPSDIPIIILTSYDWSDIEDEALKAGINGFTQKPFFLSSLRNTLESLDSKIDNPTSGDVDNVLAGKRILAAEDNALNSEILAALLEMVGAKCKIVENGQEIVEQFEKSEPDEYDMIIMDVQMPVMNGHDAARAIRQSAHPNAKSIPIIAMTANAFVNDVKDAIEAGMDAHISKPLDMEILMNTVKDVMDKKQK